jgi:regulator of sirC expression with transglutaminase-like and TPR domain
MAQVSDPASAFAAELPNASPERLALAIARIAYPDLDAEKYLHQLDQMSAVVKMRVAEAAPGGQRALALIQAMRLDLGLRGNTERYYDAANSYLNVVLERRTGLPIMLCMIVMAIGQRLGLSVEGAGFPGHFMARYEDEEGVWILDPFHGAVMTPDDVQAYFIKLFGQGSVTVDASHFTPVAATAWALRILNNLRAVFLNGGEMSMLAKVLPLMLLLEPERGELWQELGVVAYRRGELEQAARALRRYFFLQGQLVLTLPGTKSASVPPALDPTEQQVWNLLAEIETMRSRWN